MRRVLLVHWNAQEASEKARLLEKLGCQVEILCDSEQWRLGEIRRAPPDLLLIDLARLPSQGREIAGYFRRLKATRAVPILFVGEDQERIERARSLLPDAHFTAWADIQAAVASAIDSAPAKPVVPSTMAGYSGTPLPKKLGIRENDSVALVNEPEGFRGKLQPLARGAQIGSRVASARVAILFATSQSELKRDFRPLIKALPEKSALWLAWPKRTSGVTTDLTETLVREMGLRAGWVDYKICAIDATWSALCFARRKQAK